MEKQKSTRGKDYTTSELLDFVIFLSGGEKTKDEIRSGLSKIFEGRHGDPIPGFMVRVKQALMKDGESGLKMRIVKENSWTISSILNIFLKNTLEREEREGVDRKLI